MPPADRTPSADATPEPWTDAELASLRAMPDWERHTDVDRWFLTLEQQRQRADALAGALRTTRDEQVERIAAVLDAILGGTPTDEEAAELYDAGLRATPDSTT